MVVAMIKRFTCISIAVLSTINATFSQDNPPQVVMEPDSQSFEQATQDNEGLFNQGYAYYRDREFDKARSIFQQIIDADPKNYAAQLNMGSIYHKQKQLEKAIKKFTFCIDIEPDNPRAYFNLGLVYMDQEKYDIALEQFLKSCDLDPLNARTLYFIGDTYYILEDYDKALAYFSQTWSLDSSMRENYLRIADCYRQQGKIHQEADVYRKLIADQPSFYLYYRLAMAMGNAGNAAQEIQAYKMALSLKPDNVDAHFNLGLAYFNTGNMTDAKQEFEAISVNTDTPDHEAIYYLGLIANAEGDTYTAWSYYEQLQNLNPQFADQLYSQLKPQSK